MKKLAKKKAAKKLAKKKAAKKRLLKGAKGFRFGKIKSAKKAAKKAAKKKSAKKKLKVNKIKLGKNFVADEWESPYWDELSKMNVDRAVCEFEGGGDDGCVHTCKLYKNDGKVVEVQALFGGTEEEKKIVESLSGPIWERYCGFNWFERCDGELTWNVAKKQIEWTGNHEPEMGDYE